MARRGRNYWTYLYFFQSSAPPHLIKIGQSSRPLSRYKELMTGSPVELIPVFLIKANVIAEQILHMAFGDQWAHGQWYQPHPNLKKLVRGWKKSKYHLLTPEIASETIPPLATFTGIYPYGWTLRDYLDCYRSAFDVDGLKDGPRMRIRPTLAWRRTYVVKGA